MSAPTRMAAIKRRCGQAKTEIDGQKIGGSFAHRHGHQLDKPKINGDSRNAVGWRLVMVERGMGA